MRQHHIESRIGERERPCIPGLDAYAIGYTFTASVFKGGVGGIVGLVLCTPKIDACSPARRQPSCCRDKHKSTAATDIQHRFPPCPRHDSLGEIEEALPCVQLADPAAIGHVRRHAETV